MDPGRIQRLLPRHYRIIELAAAGHDPKVIGEAIGMGVAGVRMVLDSPLVIAELTRMRKEDRIPEIIAMDREAVMGKAMSILEQGSIRAAEVNLSLLDSADGSIQLRASKQILDRVFGLGKEGGGSGTVINITAENVQLLNNALKESENVRKHTPTADETPALDSQAGEHCDVHQGSEACGAVECAQGYEDVMVGGGAA